MTLAKKYLKSFNEASDDETTEPSSVWSMGVGYRYDMHKNVLYGLDSSVHTNDGYKLVPVSNKIHLALVANINHGLKDVEKIMVDKDIVTVKISNKKGFESRFRDFEKMGDAGLIGFRFESNGGNLITLLYFKPS